MKQTYCLTQKEKSVIQYLVKNRNSYRKPIEATRLTQIIYSDEIINKLENTLSRDGDSSKLNEMVFSYLGRMKSKGLINFKKDTGEVFYSSRGKYMLNNTVETKKIVAEIPKQVWDTLRTMARDEGKTLKSYTEQILIKISEMENE